MVFNTCKELSLALAKDSAFGFLSAVPTFNDLFRLVSELAKLSKTLMENKKMFNIQQYERAKKARDLYRHINPYTITST